MSFLTFTKTQPVHRLTPIYEVASKDGVPLGQVRWFSHWRRYVFAVEDVAAVFDAACLIEITQFIQRLMDERKTRLGPPARVTEQSY